MTEELVIFSGGEVLGSKAHTYPYVTSTLRQQYPILPPSMDTHPTKRTSSYLKKSFSITTPSSSCENRPIHFNGNYREKKLRGKIKKIKFTYMGSTDRPSIH